MLSDSSNELNEKVFEEYNSNNNEELGGVRKDYSTLDKCENEGITLMLIADYQKHPFMPLQMLNDSSTVD